VLHPSFPFDGTNIHVTISERLPVDRIVQEFRYSHNKPCKISRSAGGFMIVAVAVVVAAVMVPTADGSAVVIAVRRLQSVGGLSERTQPLPRPVVSRCAPPQRPANSKVWEPRHRHRGPLPNSSTECRRCCKCSGVSELLHLQLKKKRLVLSRKREQCFLSLLYETAYHENLQYSPNCYRCCPGNAEVDAATTGTTIPRHCTELVPAASGPYVRKRATPRTVFERLASS
jgi:hypothetical protein